MRNPDIGIDDLTALFIADTPLIDVRAPVEFTQGSLSGAVNLPILNDEERALVGTTYKQQGSEAAIKLGYEMVSGSVKQNRLQQWLRNTSVDRSLITGGYKRARQFLINTLDQFSEHRKLLVITGPTGSGKTLLIHDISNSHPVLDIEAIAPGIAAPPSAECLFLNLHKSISKTTWPSTCSGWNEITHPGSGRER